MHGGNEEVFIQGDNFALSAKIRTKQNKKPTLDPAIPLLGIQFTDRFTQNLEFGLQVDVKWQVCPMLLWHQLCNQKCGNN